MSQTVLVQFFVSIASFILAAAFRALKPDVLTRTWVTFIVSIIGGYVVLAILGTIPWVPTPPAAGFSDPFAFFQAIGDFLGSLGPVLGAVFLVAQIIYEALGTVTTKEIARRFAPQNLARLSGLTLAGPFPLGRTRLLLGASALKGLLWIYFATSSAGIDSGDSRRKSNLPMSPMMTP